MSEQFDCAILAGFLDSGRALAAASNAAGMIAVVGCVAAGSLYARIALACSAALWILQVWFAVRVRIDASLFRVLSGDSRDSVARLDALLTDWGFIKRSTERSIADRSRGALKLWRKQAASLILQFCALAAGIGLLIAVT